MEGQSDEIGAQSLASTENDIEDLDDNIDLSEVNRLEEILSNAGNVKMLEYERQMFMDGVYNDSLSICAKGISYERVLANLLRVYLSPSNLVLVVNSDDYEEKFYRKLLDAPYIYEVSSNANEREKNYLSGGVQFISTRILVVDLLKDRIPAALITGIVVLRAHQIIESCQEAFALRLYRQKNKVGFIKAFTMSAEAFTQGYGHVEKVMRNIFVKELYLWPRFHALIQKDLKAFEPTSVEFHIPLSDKTTKIQSHLLDLMNFIVKELKRINPLVDLEEVTVENCVSKQFQKILQSQLDVIWHQLNSKTKLLIADLKTLRSLMFIAIYSDSVAFLTAVRRYRTTEYAMSNSGWTLLSAAEQIFKLAKERVFNSKDEFDPEPCPKWKALSEILRVEIPSDIKKLIKDKTIRFDKEKSTRVLILCNDARTCYQLSQYLTQGSERTLFWSALKDEIPVQKLSDKYKKLQGGGSGVVGDTVTVKKIQLGDEKNPSLPNVKKVENVPLKLSTLKDRKRKMDETKKSEDTADSTSREVDYRDSYLLTMSQTVDGNQSFDASDFDTSKSDKVEFEAFDQEFDLDATAIISAMEKPVVCIQTFRSDKDKFSSLDQTLLEMQPDYVIMFNSNMTAIRQIEIFEARLQRPTKRRLKVFVLMHSKTVEEQSFLTILRREKKAFEFLIQSKRTMVVPEYQDGKSEVFDIAQSNKEEEVSTRQAGGREMQKKEPPMVIVDSREFRSELPCLIHRRGMQVIPLMITVGDYILSPDICVERKSISDLIQSLHGGRLYNQCQQMMRFYSKPILLIEFDQNRPFHLQGRYMLSRESETSNSDIMQKLQLLTIHFPKLRIVWSPSPYATAQLFEEIKQNKEQPNPESVTQAGLEDPSQDFDVITERYNPNIYDFVMKLPGISSRNVHAVMRRGKNLKELLKFDSQQLDEMLGNKKDAEALHSALHSSLKPKVDQQQSKINSKLKNKQFRK